MTDAEIIRTVLAGDVEAYTGLIRRYQNVVYGLAYHYLRDFDDAQDVAQEAFLRAYLQLRQLRDPERFAGWLRQLTVNECRMWRRRRRVSEPLDRLDESLVSKWGDQEWDHRLFIEQVLGCLTEPNRLTVTLFYFESYSLSEIADFLSVPLTTVKSRLRNAKAQMRKEWVKMTEDAFDRQKLLDEFARPIVEFFQAVRANDSERVRQFVAKHPSLAHRRYLRQDGKLARNWSEGEWIAAEEEDSRADTALHFAAFYGCDALIRVLLDQGADINALDHDGRTPLELAAWEGGLEALRAILEYSPDLSLSGAKALKTAAVHRASDRCRLLLEHGAEPDLHTAIILGMEERVRALIDADPSLTEAHGTWECTPLDIAAEWGQSQIAERLIEKGAKVTLLHAAGLGLLERVKQQVAQAPGQVNPTDGSRTPLMAAARNGHVKVVEFLLSVGADVHLGEAEHVHRILPIHVAAPAAVDLLVAAGAHVNVPYRGFTPLQRALSHGDEALVEALRRHGGLKHLHLPCGRGDLAMVETLIRLGADVNERDAEGRTPLDTVQARLNGAEIPDAQVRARYTALRDLLQEHGGTVSEGAS